MTLALPQLTAYDPPESGEGTLDPMGLGTISERLASDLVPDFRARMTTFPFLTTIAVSTVACSDLSGAHSADDRTAWPVAFEWLIGEAFARHNVTATGIPGARKARATVLRKQRLSASTYLKGPTVFGFHGVYKPLALALGIVGAGDYGPGDFTPGPNADRLVRAWEGETGLAGFADNRRGSEGAKLRGQIRHAVADSLKEGRCAAKPNSAVFGTLAKFLNPAELGIGEAHVLRQLFDERSSPETRELAQLIDEREFTFERDVLSEIISSASPGLKPLLTAIDAYERFAAALHVVFDTMRFASTATDTERTCSTTNLASDDGAILAQVLTTLPGLYDAAVRSLPLRQSEFEGSFAGFQDVDSVSDLALRCLEHHEAVQRRKGCQPWFDREHERFRIRYPYRQTSTPEMRDGYVHPVRIAPLAQFLVATHD